MNKEKQDKKQDDGFLNLLSGFAWWKLDYTELEEQVNKYGSLGVTKSVRGISVLLILGSLILTTVAAVIEWVSVADVVGSAIIYLPISFFIYRGKRWAMLLMLALWTLEKAFAATIIINLNSNSTSLLSSALIILFWWSFPMRYFYAAFKVEEIRNRSRSIGGWVAEKLLPMRGLLYPSPIKMNMENKLATDNHQIHLVIRIPRIRRVIPVIAVLVILLFASLGTALAFSTKLRSEGDAEYAKQNYAAALQKYNAARNWWLPEKISPKLRDRDLHSKIAKAEIMVKSAENYIKGMDAFNKKQYSEAKSSLSLLDLKDPHYQEAQNTLKSIEKIEEELSKPIPIPASTPKQSPDGDKNTIEITVLNYKLDALNGKSSSEILLTALYNNPSVVCSKIIEGENTRGHVYYMYLDFYNNLESKYGKYRYFSPYIENNLNSLFGIVQKTKTDCVAVGYQIPVD